MRRKLLPKPTKLLLGWVSTPGHHETCSFHLGEEQPSWNSFGGIWYTMSSQRLWDDKASLLGVETNIKALYKLWLHQDGHWELERIEIKEEG